MTDSDRVEIRAEYRALRNWLLGIAAALVLAGVTALVQAGTLIERLETTAALAVKTAERVDVIERREAVRDTATARTEERLLAITSQLTELLSEQRAQRAELAGLSRQIAAYLRDPHTPTREAPR